jgi:GNAT superfamily N-acetyltransferase
MLHDGHIEVPPGKVAAVITHLRMLAPPTLGPAPEDPELRIRHVQRPAPEWYRGLYRRVGENWLWFERLKLSDAALEAILHHPLVEVYALASGADDVGLCELDFRIAEHCQLACFALTPEFIGHGAGRLLMHHAITRAWQRPIACLWLHTCTLDHPRALDFYMRTGYRPFWRQIFIANDPRLTMGLPTSAAPHVPLI